MEAKMKQYLHLGDGIDYLLFDFWKPTGALQTFFSCLTICTIGVFYEATKYAKEVVALKLKQIDGQKNSDKTYLGNLFEFYYMLLHVTLLFFFNIQMLIFSTFNVYFQAANVIGAALGYLLFKPLRARMATISRQYTAI